MQMPDRFDGLLPEVQIGGCREHSSPIIAHWPTKTKVRSMYSRIEEYILDCLDEADPADLDIEKAQGIAAGEVDACRAEMLERMEKALLESPTADIFGIGYHAVRPRVVAALRRSFS